MSNKILRIRIFEELQKIPETKLEEVYDFLHYFRIGLESTGVVSGSPVSSFAGAWNDMEESAFKEFEEEIENRRHQAFGSRRPE